MTTATSTTITDLTAQFRAALSDPRRVGGLLAADEVAGLPVHPFPAPRRSEDGRTRLGLLLTMRSILGDLIARPDLLLTGTSHTIHPDVDDASDHDLVHDVVIEQGELDLEVPPSVALARFGIHASGFGGIDPDPLYARPDGAARWPRQRRPPGAAAGPPDRPDPRHRDRLALVGRA